jgi:hypothetical protein
LDEREVGRGTTGGTPSNHIVKKRKTNEQDSNKGKSDEMGAAGGDEENANLRAQLMEMTGQMARQKERISQLEVQ